MIINFYRYIVEGEHLPKKFANFCGTETFAAYWTLKEIRQSRRNDLYSLGNTLLYLLLSRNVYYELRE